jgi:hypothetical protein
VVHKTWKDSGAADWWKKWIHDNGAKDWSDKFFQQVIADGEQGGSTFDCTALSSSNCPGPAAKSCRTYTPPQAFYMHLQIGNLFDGFNAFWMETVEDAIGQLSSGIKAIVSEYGTPPQEENSDFLNMLIGILTSLAGFGAAKPLLTGTMTSFAGIFTAMGAGTSWEETVSPETLNDKLEIAYGNMFNNVMNSTKGFVGHIFGGVPPKGWSDDKMTEYVYDFFKDADWLSKDITKPAMKTYIEQVHSKWVSPQLWDLICMFR